MQAVTTQNQATGDSLTAYHVWLQVILKNWRVGLNVTHLYLHHPGLIIMDESLVVAIYRHQPVHADSTVEYRFNDGPSSHTVGQH